MVAFVVTNTIGQINLNVPLKAQLTDKWCWAACSEMIATYNIKATTQKEIAIYLFNKKVPSWKSRYTNAVTVYNADIPYLFVPCGVGYNCNIYATTPNILKSDRTFCLKSRYMGNTISVFRKNSDPKDYEYLFTQMGFNSDQVPSDSSTIYNLIKDQLDSCKPVIIFKGLARGNAHVILAKGYNILSGGSSPIKLLYINDPSFKPSGNCHIGDQYIITEEFLKVQYTTGRTGIVKKTAPTDDRIISIVKDIQAKDGPTNCDSQNAITVGMDIFTELTKHFQQPDTKDADSVIIRTISEKLIKKKPVNITGSVTKRVLYKNKSLLKFKNNIAYFYDMIDSEYFLTKVSKGNLFKFNPIIDIKSIQENLNNKENIGTKYDVIEYPSLDFLFFRFKSKKDDKWYLAPCQDYILNNRKLTKHRAYPEKRILNKLRIAT